jgi:glycosyltransferase involved in cell wall biosynthesis
MFVGRLIREKGILDLLEAVALIDDFDLTIVGEQQPSDRGGVSHEINEFISSHGLGERVRRAGQLSQSQLRELVKEIDVVVLPSYREGVPRSLIEAMAAGRPIVGTDARGCRELVVDGVNGYLVPIHQPTALADALQKLANASPEVLAEMGSAARKQALERHQESAIFDRLSAVYREIGITKQSSGDGE